jgi:hypothetical protein
MSGRERGKKLLADLATKVRKEMAPNGEPILHARGQKAIAELAADLSGNDGPPGLRVFRDAVDRFRLQRPGRDAQVSIGWQRPIGAIVMITEHGDKRDPEVRYLYADADDEWRRMDGDGELYADVAKSLSELMYPESKR